MTFERLGTVHNATGECPVWHPGEQALYWTDIPSRCLWRWDAASGQTRSWTLPEMAGCIAATGDDAWLLAAQTGLFAAPHLAPDADAATLHRVADVTHAAPGMRFNDGRTDRQGRFWCSTMVMDADARSNAGKLYRYDLDGLSMPVLDDLMIPNGLAFSPDGHRMYLSDSHPDRGAVWVFDYDSDDGVPSNRRLFTDLHPRTGRPDGAAVDCDGAYWTCANGEGVLLRFTPDGVLDRTVDLPMREPTMCAFGGSDMRTLFVTSARPQDGDMAKDPLGGAVIALQVGARGLADTPFPGIGSARHA